MTRPRAKSVSVRGPLRRAFLWARKAAPDFLFFGGLLIVALGVGMIYLPAGVIVAGTSLAGCVYLAERRR